LPKMVASVAASTPGAIFANNVNKCLN